MKPTMREIALLLSVLLLSSCSAETPPESEVPPVVPVTEEIVLSEPEEAVYEEISVPDELPVQEISAADPALAAENLERAVQYGKRIREMYWDSETCLSSLTPDGGKPHLWPFTEQAAMVNGILLAMDESHEDYAYFVDYLTELIEGLRHYRIRDVRLSGKQTWNNENHVLAAFGETDGTGNCYAVYSSSRNDASVDRIVAMPDAVYFDDNVWVAKEMYYAYVNLGDERYLNEAVNILNWIVGEGYEPTEGLNGIYWKWSSKFEFAGGDYSDSNHASLNACSTVPTAMMLAKVCRITEGNEKFADLREEYLTKAQALYEFTYDVLRDPASGCIQDKIFLREGFASHEASKRIQKTDGSQYAYNTGTYMTAGAELYEIAVSAGDADRAAVLAERNTKAAASADKKFADTSVKAGEYSYPSHSWFTSFLLEGFADLASHVPDAAEYIGHMRSSLDYAWNNYRADDGLVCPSWIKGWTRFNNNDADSEDNPRQILLQSANAHCYAMLARYYRGN